MESPNEKTSWRMVFSEESGISMMRVMSLVSLTVGSILGLAGLWMRIDLTQLALLCGVFVGAAFGGKTVQKFAELASKGEPRE